jgi:hypothetical protein
MNPTEDVNLGWAYEGIAFHTVLPVNGTACPAGFNPVYRSYNQRFSPNPALNDGNHRLTPSRNDHVRAITFLGYKDEGVAFCSPAAETSAGADLHATFKYPGATVKSGDPLPVEFTYGNNSAGQANGARIHGSLPPHATNWDIECTATGGATCPAQLSVAQLRSGVEVSSWPAGGVLTVTVSGIAPAIAPGVEPTLTFGSTVASAGGSTDSNSANNTPPVAQSVIKGPAVCNVVLSPARLVLGPESRPVDLNVIVGATCPWTLESRPSWLAVSESSGTDDR